MIKDITTKLRTRRVTTAVLTAFALSAIFPIATSSVRAQAPRKAASERGGQKEGIKVHGHWTIEVQNPDGTLVTRREFENALTPEGGTTLALVLGLKNTFGEWAIRLKGDTNANEPCAFQDLGSGQLVPIPCVVSQGNGDLKLDVPGSGENANKLVITGQATAQRSGNISTVQTDVGRCQMNSPNCGGSGYRFTASPVRDVTGQPTTLPVTAGRIIQVTVIISFS